MASSSKSPGHGFVGARVGDEVDLVGGVVRLDCFLCPCPFVRSSSAARCYVVTIRPYKDGVPVGDWRKAWHRACRVAGCPAKRFHDLRRTVARNLIRSGVSERVAMALLGHRTRSVFDRYNIVSEADLKQATGKLAYYVSAQSPRVPVAAK